MDIYSVRFLGMNAIWGSPRDLQAENDEAAISAVARVEHYGQGYEILQSDRLVARSGSGPQASDPSRLRQ